jgi:hypothetical protein
LSILTLILSTNWQAQHIDVKGLTWHLPAINVHPYKPQFAVDKCDRLNPDRLWVNVTSPNCAGCKSLWLASC